MRLPFAFTVGLIFGVGIIVSGMANPAKVLNFFDVAGSWDPSLAFVMGGAILVAMLGFRLAAGQVAPVLGPRFSWPTKRDVDARLISGAAIFGVGWGLAGFCPGGALPMLGTGRADVILFCAAMIAGVFVARAVERRPEDPAAKEPKAAGSA